MQLLNICQDFRSLEFHAQEACRKIGMREDKLSSVIQQLEALARQHLLISNREVVEVCRNLPESCAPPPVSVLAVITRDRLPVLKRCLPTYIENAKEHGRDVEFVVVDNSDLANNRANMYELLRGLYSRFAVRITYSGRVEKSHFIELLCRKGGFPRELLDFTLKGLDTTLVSPGANRNTLLLHTLGSMFVSVDDDTSCSLGRIPELRHSTMSFNSEEDPTEFWFFRDRDSAAAAVNKVSVDFLGIHEGLLGKPILGCVQNFPDLDLSQVNDNLVEWLTSGGGTILTTQTGLYGDSGMSSPSWLLTIDGPSRERLTHSGLDYEMARRTRQVIRGVRCPTLADSDFFMTYSAGFDNRQILPPFIPVLRNQDGAFGFVMRKCFDHTCVGQLPYLIWHDPPEPRAYSEEAIWRDGSYLHFTHLLLACLISLPPWNFSDSRRRMRAIGSHLTELGSLPPTRFENHLRMILLEQIVRRIQHLERQLEEFHRSPAYWADDVRRAIKHTSARLTSSDFIVPMDLLAGGGPVQAMATAQQLVLRFGQLFSIWPDLVEATRDLYRSGNSIAVPNR